MTNDPIVIYRCEECGYVHPSLGWMHAHVERHRGYTRFGIQIPFTRTSVGDFDALMDRTEVLVVTDAETLPIEDVEEPERTRFDHDYDT